MKAGNMLWRMRQRRILEWMDQMLEQGTAEAREKLLAFFEIKKWTRRHIETRSNAMIEMIVVVGYL